MDRIATDGIALDFDPEGGIISDLVIAAETALGGKALRPLHRAPWLDGNETLPASVAPVESKLAGDFFCAPFGQSTAEVAIHGWAANGNWRSAGQSAEADGGLTATYHLRQPIMGASLTKRITLRPGHPVVYQTHRFDGGAGRIPVAHHAMIHVPGGAQLSFSGKQGGATPVQALETDPARGRSILRYPQHFEDLASVMRADGETVDASLYPFAGSHEDLAVLTEMPGAPLGWSAAVAAKDGFVFVAVKDALTLPQTVLWMSNGGRNYAPWNGRHRAVLGIEEGAVGIHLDETAAPDSAPGILLGSATTIAYAFGAIALPKGWTRIADIAVAADTLTLTDASGETRSLPFAGAHFGIVE